MRQAMDPRAITLAQLEFEEFNEQVCTRGRSRILDPGERRLAFPEFPTGPLVRLPKAGQSWLGMLPLNWAARPARGGLRLDETKPDGPGGHLCPRGEAELSDRPLFGVRLFIAQTCGSTSSSVDAISTNGDQDMKRLHAIGA